MTDKYVDSAAGGTASGDDWTNAYTTIGAYPGPSAGTDRVFIASGHTCTSDTTWPGLTGGDGPLPISISVDKTGSVPPVNADILAGANLTENGNDWLLTSAIYMEAITLTSGRFVSVGGTNSNVITKDCIYKVGLDDAFQFGGTSGFCVHYNLTFDSSDTSVGNNSGGISANYNNGGATHVFYGGTCATDLQYRDFILQSLTVGNTFIFNGTDFSQWGVTGGTVNLVNGTTLESTVIFNNCKFPHSITFSMPGTAAVQGQGRIECWGCGSLNNTDQEQMFIHDQWGTAEAWGGGLANRAVYRTTNGATPPHQTTPISWRAEITSRCGITQGFWLPPLYKYYSTTGATKTITVHYLVEDATTAVALDDSQLELLIEYYSATGVLMGYERTHSGVLSTLGGETNHASGDSWTTTDALSSTLNLKITHTTASNIAQEGFIKVTPIIYDIGTNDAIYIDPIMEIS